MGLGVKEFRLTGLNPKKKKKEKNSNILISPIFFILFIMRYIVTWVIYHLISAQNENGKKIGLTICFNPKNGIPVDILVYRPIFKTLTLQTRYFIFRTLYMSSFDCSNNRPCVRGLIRRLMKGVFCAVFEFGKSCTFF